MSLDGKVVLVTGAGRGLGRALAGGFAAGGARVAVNDLNPDSAAAAVHEIIQAGGQAIALTADVANKLAVQTMHYEILERWGRVDILINTAAIQPAGPALTLDEWAWDRVLDVNLKGAFLCSQTVARGMKEQGGGLIVNVANSASGASAAAGPDRHAAFAASRAGLHGLTLACAREFATYNIRVHLARRQPGSQPEAAAAAVLKLCAGAPEAGPYLLDI